MYLSFAAPFHASLAHQTIGIDQTNDDVSFSIHQFVSNDLYPFIFVSVARTRVCVFSNPNHKNKHQRHCSSNSRSGD